MLPTVTRRTIPTNRIFPIRECYPDPLRPGRALERDCPPIRRGTVSYGTIYGVPTPPRPSQQTAWVVNLTTVARAAKTLSVQTPISMAMPFISLSNKLIPVYQVLPHTTSLMPMNSRSRWLKMLGLVRKEYRCQVTRSPRRSSVLITLPSVSV